MTSPSGDLDPWGRIRAGIATAMVELGRGLKQEGLILASKSSVTATDRALAADLQHDIQEGGFSVKLQDGAAAIGADIQGYARLHRARHRNKMGAAIKKLKRAKLKAKQERRDGRKRLRQELGDAAPPKLVARTLENTREFDETIIGAA